MSESILPNQASLEPCIDEMTLEWEAYDLDLEPILSEIAAFAIFYEGYHNKAKHWSRVNIDLQNFNETKQITIPAVPKNAPYMIELYPVHKSGKFFTRVSPTETTREYKTTKYGPYFRWDCEGNTFS